MLEVEPGSSSYRSQQTIAATKPELTSDISHLFIAWRIQLSLQTPVYIRCYTYVIAINTNLILSSV